jgi:hypothetical protein
VGYTYGSEMLCRLVWYDYILSHNSMKVVTVPSTVPSTSRLARLLASRPRRDIVDMQEVN